MTRPNRIPDWALSLAAAVVVFFAILKNKKLLLEIRKLLDAA